MRPQVANLPAARTLRVGLVGAGFGRSVILPALRRVPGVSAVAMATSRPAGPAGLAPGKGPEFFPHWEDLVASSEVDAVVVATPPASHAAIVARALRCGKAVLCEKPLAASVPEARRLAAMAGRAGVPAAVNFEFREIAAMRELKARLDRGDLGAVRSLRVDWRSGSGADPARPWTWRADRAAGGGVLGAFGCHAFDYLRWLAGPPRRLAARLATRVPRRPDGEGALLPCTAEDEAHLLLDFRGGATATVSLSQAAAGGLVHRIEVQAERGLFVVAREAVAGGVRFGAWEARGPDEAPRPVAVGGEAPPEPGLDERIPLVEATLRRFLAAAAGDAGAGAPSFEDGLRAQVMMDAAVRSDRERAWVDLRESRA